MALVVLDPGHGGEQAAGRSTPLGHRPLVGAPEKQVTLAVARDVASRLGGSAVLTGSDDYNLSLADRRAVARKESARAFVSFHTSPHRVGNGAEVWHHPSANGESRTLAATLAESLGGVPVRADAEMAILSPDVDARLAAVLVELDHDEAADPRGRASLGDRLGRGLETWIGQNAALGRRAPARPAPRGFGDRAPSDPDRYGIDGPIPEVPPIASGQGWARALQVSPEYPRASRFAAAAEGNFEVPSTTRTISKIVIHITDGRSTASTVSWFQTAPADRPEPHNPSSAHYVVGQDGEVVQMVLHNNIAYHARRANMDTIGVEHVAVSPATALRNGWSELLPSDLEYTESAALVSWLCDTYGIPKDREHIVGHSEIGARNHPDCPQTAWDWDHYMSLVQGGESRVRGRQPAQGTWGTGFSHPHGSGDSYGNRRLGRAAPVRGQELLQVDLGGATTAAEIARRLATMVGRQAAWMVGVPDTTVFPFSAVCQLVLSDGSGTAYGTGFYIGPETLLSCGHNFYNRRANNTIWRARQVLVQPGHNPVASTFATKSFTVDGRDLVHDTWRAAVDTSYAATQAVAALGTDLSVLRVPGLPAPRGDWFTLPDVCPVPQDHFVCGFGKLRSDATMAQEPMRVEGGPVLQVDQDLLEYAVNTRGGNSGSPVFVNDGSGMVIGVHTGSPVTSPRGTANRGVYLGPDKVDWINTRA